MTTDTERAEFEAWAQANDFCIHRDDSEKYRDYHRATTRWAWLAWQAARASKAGEATAPEGYEKMRGGLPASFWRDDALEQAAIIAERYSADPWIARDIRAMQSRAAHPTTGDKNG